MQGRQDLAHLYQSVDTGHDVMIHQPQWLADVLLKVS